MFWLCFFVRRDFGAGKRHQPGRVVDFVLETAREGSPEIYFHHERLREIKVNLFRKRASCFVYFLLVTAETPLKGSFEKLKRFLNQNDSRRKFKRNGRAAREEKGTKGGERERESSEVQRGQREVSLEDSNFVATKRS